MFTIAEIGQAHDGSLGMAHAYIEALAKTGVSAVKFQLHIAKAESSIHEPFRIQFSPQDSTRFEYWKRMEFTLDQWLSLKQHCDDVGVEFIASPFSNLAVDWLEKMGVKRYKIGSGEVNNFLLLEKISRTGKPVILSSGMSALHELDSSIAFLKDKSIDVSILQCTTSYPTTPENYGLNVIKVLKERYQIPVGFSDHSGKITAGIAAASLGAELLEFHVAFSKQQFGPDSSSSLTIEEVKSLVEHVDIVETALQHPMDKTTNVNFQHLKSIFEKSLAVNKNLKKGHILTFDDLEAKKPKGHGISPENYKQVIGKSLRGNKEAWDFLKDEDLE
jgi:N-acetylneuraminate synthase